MAKFHSIASGINYIMKTIRPTAPRSRRAANSRFVLTSLSPVHAAPATSQPLYEEIEE
jgi:hypothetical protein